MPKKSIRHEFIIPPAPIRKGEMGLDVYNLQLVLDHILKYRGKASLYTHEQGHFGVMTERALREFQANNKLFINGEYTPVTRLRIKEVLNGTFN